MATIAQSYNDDEQEQQGQNGLETGGSGGAGTQGQGGSAGAVSNVQQNVAPQNNQGYTDVASYLNANQGGSEQLGQQVTTNLNNKYNTTKQGVTDSANQFNQDISAGYTQANSDLINQVAADPLSAANNADQLSAFQAQLNNTYKGPTSWADKGTQQGKVNEATQYSSLANTPGGLNVYAQEVEGQTGGPQSQGINQLDTLLLGGSPTAMGQVKGAASQYKDLNDYINQMNTAGLNNVAQATTAAQNSSQQALEAFTGANGVLTNLNTSINTNADKARTDAIARQEALDKALSGIYTQPVDTSSTTLGTYGGGSTPWYNSTNYNVNDTLSAADLADLGITQDQWSALRNAMQRSGTSEFKSGHNFGANSPTAQIALDEFITRLDPNNITAATTATSDQYAQMDAIQKLLGGKTPQGNAINPALASLAGTAPKDLTDFNYQNALDLSTNYADEARRAAQEMADQLTGHANLAHADSMHGRTFLDKVKKFAPLNMPYAVTKGLIDQGKKTAGIK